MSEEAVSKLRLNAEMSWIELGFGNLHWLIQLKWENGILFFNKEWFELTETVNLREGDICVIARSSHFQKLKLAILENSQRAEVNSNGIVYA